MNELKIAVQEIELGERSHMAEIDPWAYVDMRRQGDVETVRGVVFLAIDLRRNRLERHLAVGRRDGVLHAAPGETQRDQALVGIGRPGVVQSLDVGEVDWLRHRNPTCGPVGEAGPDATLAERPQILLDMLGRARVVAPSWTKVIPALSASADDSLVPWYMSLGR